MRKKLDNPKLLFPTPVVGVSNILCQIAGSNISVLEHCPEDVPKHATLGLLIVFVGILAGGSMAFALSIMGIQGDFILPTAFFWGSGIFLIDRFIVSSYRKTPSMMTNIGQSIPRILMAAIIGFTLSIPLELRLFQGDIETTLSSMKEVAKIKFEKDRLVQLESLRSGLVQDKERVSADIKSRNDQINSLREIYVSAWSRAKSEIQSPRDRKRLGQEAYDAQNAYNQNKRESLPLIVKLEKQRDSLNHEISKVKLDNEQFVFEEGLLQRLAALDKLSASSTEVTWSKWAIRLLILFLEITPVLAKVLTPTSGYDIILQAAHEMRKTQLEAKHDLQKLKNQVLYHSNTNKFNEHAQKNQQLNQDIYNEMAQAQLELVKVGLKIWKEDMKSQIKTNPGVIIKSTGNSNIQSQNIVNPNLQGHSQNSTQTTQQPITINQQNSTEQRDDNSGSMPDNSSHMGS